MYSILFQKRFVRKGQNVHIVIRNPGVGCKM